jgi:hypothetical protein
MAKLVQVIASITRHEVKCIPHHKKKKKKMCSGVLGSAGLLRKGWGREE